MDTTETNIKMCEKAEEIQEQYDCTEKHNIRLCLACKTEWGNCYEHTEYLSCNSELGGRPFPVVAVKNVEHKPIWLPRQDQLQEMVGEYPDCFHKFNNWLESWQGFEDDKAKTEYVGQFNSMEQLWLAFVMKERYNKVWNGEDWVKA